MTQRVWVSVAAADEMPNKKPKQNHKIKSKKSTLSETKWAITRRDNKKSQTKQEKRRAKDNGLGFQRVCWLLRISSGWVGLVTVFGLGLGLFGIGLDRFDSRRRRRRYLLHISFWQSGAKWKFPKNTLPRNGNRNSDKKPQIDSNLC